MKLAILFLLSALALPAVDWTTQNPLLTSFEVRNDSGRTIIDAEVTFRGDGGETYIKRYHVSGDSALTALQRRVYDDRATLQIADGLTEGASVSPVAPTAADSAITAYVDAVRKLQALEDLVVLMGWEDSTEIGTSGRTVDQVRTSLKNTIVTDFTTQGRIAVGLQNFPFR